MSSIGIALGAHGVTVGGVVVGEKGSVDDEIVLLGGGTIGSGRGMSGSLDGE